MLQAQRLNPPGARGPKNAGSMRLIDHQQGFVLLSQADNIFQRGQVPVHRKDRLGQDQLTPRRWTAGELALQVFGVTVIVNQNLSTRQTAAVDQAGVIQRVAENCVAGASQRRDRAEIGLIPGGKNQRSFAALKTRQVALQISIKLQVAADQPRPGRAAAIVFHRLKRGLLQPLIGSQSEVVIGTEQQDLSAIPANFRSGLAFQLAQLSSQSRLLEGREPFAEKSCGIGSQIGFGSGSRHELSRDAVVVKPKLSNKGCRTYLLNKVV